VCDRGGNFLDAIVLPASLDERVCALALLLQVKKQPWWRHVQVVYADSGFSGEGFGRQIQQQCGVKLEIVERSQGESKAKGFEVLPNRWLIEQLFGCQGRYRRTSRDYEQNPAIARATLQGANIHRWLRKLRPTPNEQPPFLYRKHKPL
jgi:putative transposase